MDDEIKQSKTQSKPRIALTDVSRQILEKWHSQLTDRFPGIKISNADLVNWILGSNAHELSKRQQEEIRDHYFDEVKQIEWMLAQAKSAKVSGEKFSVMPSPFQATISKKKEPSRAEDKDADSSI